MYVSLNIWFDDLKDFEGPFVLARETLSFGNPVSGLVVELLIYTHVYKELKEERLKEMISSSRYSDNINVVSLSAKEFEGVEQTDCGSILNVWLVF